MKRFSATLLAFAILAVGSGVSLLAHEGHEHKVMGTVTMAAQGVVLHDEADGGSVAAGCRFCDAPRPSTLAIPMCTTSFS